MIIPIIRTPANVGAALAIACFLSEGNRFAARWKSARILHYALPIVLMLVLVQQSYSWMRTGGIPQWSDDYHARSARAIQDLKDGLPQPPRDSEIVLVNPGSIQFDKDPPTVIRLVYHDFTLKGALFRKQQQADTYLANSKCDHTFLAIWKGTGFELRDLSRH